MFAAFNTPGTFNARFADLFMIHLRTNVTTAHQKSKPKHEFHVVIVVHITATMLKKCGTYIKFHIFRTIINNTKRQSCAHSTVSIARASEVCRATFLCYREVYKVQQQGGWDKAGHINVNLTLISLQNKVPGLIHLSTLCVYIHNLMTAKLYIIPPILAAC